VTLTTWHSPSTKVGTNFSDKRRSLPDSRHGVYIHFFSLLPFLKGACLSPYRCINVICRIKVDIIKIQSYLSSYFFSWSNIRRTRPDFTNWDCLHPSAHITIPTRKLSCNTITIKLPTVTPFAATAQYSGWPEAGQPRGRISSPCRVKNFHFSIISTPVLGSTHPIQWIPGVILTGVKWPGH
jgi:hypothetical protein